MNEPRRFWICHVRAPTHDLLRRNGFTTLYPAIDDYAFLEAKPENRKMTTKQAEFGIAFLKDKKGELKSIPEEELRAMVATTTEKLKPGTPAKVVSGFCENLEGQVTEMDEGQNKVRLVLQGYNRTYDVWLDPLDVVPAETEG